MKERFRINPIEYEVNSIAKKTNTVSGIRYICFFISTTITSLAIVLVFWCTTIFEDAILGQLALKNGTQTFAWWKDPPVHPLLKVMVFNYTNLEEYQAGNASKLRVEELGPYIYRETITRVNVVLNDNGTLTYQEGVVNVWEGGRSEDELIRVPNFPLMAAVKQSKDINYFAQLGLTAGVTLLQAEPFKTLTVKEFLWGYSDNLLDAAHTLYSITKPLPYDKFGMLIARSGISNDRITINTGSGDINSLGLYQNLNGVKSQKVWDDEECDRIEGTDGSMFPPKLIRDRDATLDVYTRDMCRKFPLRFTGYSSSFDIPTLRYEPTEDIFTSTNTTNSCYCQKTSEEGLTQKIATCPPAGTCDISACKFGVPILVSFPHFYGGDKALLNHVDGLNPQKEIHKTYAEIHPRLGAMIGGWSRLQMNVRVSVVPTVPVLEPLKDGTILPLIWFEIGVDEISEPVLGMLWHAYFTINAVENTFQWGGLLFMLFSICGLVLMTKKYMKRQPPKWPGTVSLRPGL